MFRLLRYTMPDGSERLTVPLVMCNVRDCGAMHPGIALADLERAGWLAAEANKIHFCPEHVWHPAAAPYRPKLPARGKLAGVVLSAGYRSGKLQLLRESTPEGKSGVFSIDIPLQGAAYDPR